MEKILVTGSAGMIGHNLSSALLARGYDVIGVDNYWRGKKESTEHLLEEYSSSYLFAEIDLRKSGALNPLLEGVSHVFHLADVVAGIDFVFSNQFEIWQSNLAINSNVVAALVSAKTPRVTYVGTACSYPKHLTEKIGTNRPLQEIDVLPADPESSYGWSKLIGELELQYAEAAGLLSVAILRLHNVYGFPTEYSAERSQVIPSLARKLANHPLEQFEVWGSGKQRRSFVFVDDVVAALLTTLERGLGSGPIQIGAPDSTSIGEIARILSSASGKKIPPIFLKELPEGDGDRFPDLTRAQEILGWYPKVGLEEGLARVYRWVENEVEREKQQIGDYSSLESPT